MEVFSLPECITGEAKVLVIQISKENQPKLTKRWSTVSNLSERSDDKMRPRVWMQEQRSQAMTENAKKVSEKEMALMEKDIFKPLDFDMRKSNDKKTYIKRLAFDRVFVIRF